MKYLKKIFESIEDVKEQYEIIEDFFLHFIEEQDIDNEEEPFYFEMDDADESDTYCIFRVSYYWKSKIDSLDDYMKFISIQKQKIDFLNKINTSLKRLTDLGYKWEFEESESGEGAIVLVYYKKEGEETLELALEPLSKGKRSVHESILKRVTQKKYGLTLSSTNYRDGSSGYYGRSPSLTMYFNDTFDHQHQFYKDLVSIKITRSSIDISHGLDGVHTYVTIKL